jgi:hypothetical protein
MAGELVADVLAEHPALGCWRIGTGCWRRRGWRYLTATTVFLDGGIMQGSVGL